MKILGELPAIGQPHREASTLAGALSLVFVITLIVDPFSSTSQPPSLFALVCAILLVLCIASLSFIRPQLRQAFWGSKSDFVVVDAAGISLAPIRDLPAEFRPWESIAEVVLTEQFRIIRSDGKLFCRHVVIIFLNAEPDEPENWPHRAQSGISISARGRRYLSADFPNGDWRKFRSALCRHVPDGMPVRICSKSAFDHKSGADSYIEISGHQATDVGSNECRWAIRHRSAQTQFPA